MRPHSDITSSPLIRPWMSRSGYTCCKQETFRPTALYAPQLTGRNRAIVTSILAPSGPQRSRILASLNRDERIPTVPAHISTMLTKMLLEYIVRPTELKDFEVSWVACRSCQGEER